MAERIGVLVVSYGSRAASMVDALSRSSNYDVDIYVADKQRNPFNMERAREHSVVPDLGLDKIVDFARRNRDRIDFGLVGPEGPIIDGVRDKIEETLEIPVICPTKEFALEESKVRQRLLLGECCPDANPRFRVFNKRDYNSIGDVRRDVYSWLDEFDNEVAVKPDRPGYGKGVGVWGDHFNTREALFEHFMSIYEHDSVLVEEKIDGEESSFQCFCDGKHIVPLPETRDYKRAFDGDAGPNTGGMGCYAGENGILPFITERDRAEEESVVERIFRKLRGAGLNSGLRGIPLYVAFIHTESGARILEINSRGGDPEIQTVIPLIEDDFVDVCFDMIHGTLKGMSFRSKAAVLTYKVPPGYGGFEGRFPERVDRSGVDTPVNLDGAYDLVSKYGDDLRVYPGSLGVRDGRFYAMGSRTVCCIGYGDTINEARGISVGAVEAIRGGALWYRGDIASKEHIGKSVEHMRRLRG